MTLVYETNGKRNVINFSPVSYTGLKKDFKGFSFGVPQKIKRIVERKSFKLIEIPCTYYDGLELQFTDMGYSVNKNNLFFYYKTIRVVASREPISGRGGKR